MVQYYMTWFPGAIAGSGSVRKKDFPPELAQVLDYNCKLYKMYYWAYYSAVPHPHTGHRMRLLRDQPTVGPEAVFARAVRSSRLKSITATRKFAGRAPM